MNPTIITARVSDQHLQLVNVPVIASGGVEVLQIRFEFCGLWTGCGKTAVFYRDGGEVYHVPVDDNLVTVPWEVLVDEGYFYFGVFGVKSNIRPTEIVKIKVSKGAVTEATATPEGPTPDIYSQLMAAYGHMEDRLEETIGLRDACEAAVNTLVLTHQDFVSGGYVEALKETNNGGKLLFWIGTEEEYKQDKDSLPDNTFCITTDGLTADDLRAEVAALGLGGAADKNWDDVDSITAPGWYRFYKQGGIVIGGSVYNYAYMRVDAYSENNATQVLYALNSRDLQHTYVRSKQKGEWKNWEKDILEKELLAEKADILSTAAVWDNNVRREVMGAFADIGKQFAPSGHGLGGAAPADWDEVDRLTAPGWYTFHKEGGIVIGDIVYNYAYMRVDGYNEENASQSIYTLGSNFLQQNYVRYLQKGEWTVWEKEIREKELKGERAEILMAAKELDDGLLNSVWGAFDAFRENVPPVGYGLGGIRTEDTITDWSVVDSLVAPGWYRFQTDAGISIDGIVCNYAYMRVDAYNDRHATQTLRLVKSGKSYTLVRYRVAGVWDSQWSWVNPPMINGQDVYGVEYKTTEMWADKPVYTRKIQFLAETAKHLTADFGTNNLLIFRQSAFNSSGSLPQFKATGELQADIEIYTQTGSIYYRDLRSAVSGSVWVQIWYTKD